MKRIAVLGSTGSIGRSTLAVVADWPDRFEVAALAAGRNVEVLLEQVRRFKPPLVAVAAESDAELVRRELPAPGVRVLSGAEGLHAVAVESGADTVVAALVGAVGLEPTHAALAAGIDVALANKETLVMAGELMTRTARERGATLLPLDSEHAALHQILEGKRMDHVRRLWLTASGGPFRTTPAADLARVTVEQALRHPTWMMGAKITIDSATLANKGLEVIEARWLFGMPAERIGVVVHPQSIVHALVEFVDGTYLAQMGVTDMRAPIQYALTWPERSEVKIPDLDLHRLGTLAFEPPDLERFPALALALSAARAGGGAPCVFNAANEEANLAFREKRLDFPGIPRTIAAALDALGAPAVPDLAAVHETDARARDIARRSIEEQRA